MCLPKDFRLFVRRDSKHMISGKLPNISRSPAAHMNYYGRGIPYEDSGFLSLFEYVPGARAWNEMYQRDCQPAPFAISQIFAEYIHFIFLPTSVVQVNLSEGDVREMPTSGRAPRLFNTDQCHPPAKINEDGDVLEYASRYANEYLYAGAWATGMTVITQHAKSSAIFAGMRQDASLSTIRDYCERVYPCQNGGPPPGPGGSGIVNS